MKEALYWEWMRAEQVDIQWAAAAAAAVGQSKEITRATISFLRILIFLGTQFEKLCAIGTIYSIHSVEKTSTLRYYPWCYSCDSAIETDQKIQFVENSRNETEIKGFHFDKWNPTKSEQVPTQYTEVVISDPKINKYCVAIANMLWGKRRGVARFYILSPLS